MTDEKTWGASTGADVWFDAGTDSGAVTTAASILHS
jgi:hypothetical protein